MEEYPYTEVVDGKEYTYIDMGTYYVTNLETGDRRLVQREVPFLFDDEYDTGVGDEDDTDCLTRHGEVLNPFKAEYDENGKEIFIPKSK
jgi:hypothetical protein